MKVAKLTPLEEKLFHALQATLAELDKRFYVGKKGLILKGGKH